jgi:hypothetical protein
MAIQTSFAKEVIWSQDCNYRFLALLGNDGEFDLALLDVKNRVRDLSLRETIWSFRYLDIVFPSPTLARNSLGSNEALTLFLTKAPLFLLARAALSPDEGRARREDYSDSTARMKIRFDKKIAATGRRCDQGTMRSKPGAWAWCDAAARWDLRAVSDGDP